VAKARRSAGETASVDALAKESTAIGRSTPVKKSVGSAKAAAAKRHELLVGVKPQFLKTRNVENEILRPYKRLLVDVMASEAKLDHALDAAQALFEALNDHGFHVGFAPASERMRRASVDLFEKPATSDYHRTLWVPDRVTVVHVGNMPFGLTLFEMTEEVEVVYVNHGYTPVRDLSELQLRRLVGPNHWRSKSERASGRLCLQVYCPSPLVDWSKRWQETNADTFRGLIPSIVGEIRAVVPVLEKQLQEAQIKAQEEHRLWEEQWQRWQSEAERARRDKVAKEARDDLLAAIASWDETRRVQDYFASVEAGVLDLPAEEAALIRKRLQRARELIGDLDPLEQLKSWQPPGERLSNGAKSLPS
jgi:phosphoglycolate phosphatase-like HAD superfamily hydrolase